VYGQTEVTRDMVDARDAAGQRFVYEISNTALHDIISDQPSVTYLDVDRREQRRPADQLLIGGGCGIRTRQTVNPTRFPSLPRPIIHCMIAG
jgi:p-hydroxybenzoate 3-monooxygenase